MSMSHAGDCACVIENGVSFDCVLHIKIFSAEDMK